MHIKKSFAILFGIVAGLSASQANAHVDGADSDLIVDAPWRTMRDYVPVMFFLPDVDSKDGIKAFRVYNYDPVSGQKTLIFEDRHKADQDNFPCSGVSFLSALGTPRNNLYENEITNDFWHYIARIPTSCIGANNQRGKFGVHFLWAEIARDNYETDTHTLRVVVSNKKLPKFSPIDQYYDVHVHTIAEQTTMGYLDEDASRKAFGGPLAMLMESAYALGMTDTQLTNGNWSDFKNQIVTTDHNTFFSNPPYDSGSRPKRGPTAGLTKTGEFDWYREHLGRLGGEEITLRGAHGLDKNNIYYATQNQTDYDRQGSHFLSYGAPHFEGPWHGGSFDVKIIEDDAWYNPFKYINYVFNVIDPALEIPFIDLNDYGVPDINDLFPIQMTTPGEGVNNPISITNSLRTIGSENGFGYASHPMSGAIGWSEDYYRRAIGLPYHQIYKIVELDGTAISEKIRVRKCAGEQVGCDYRDGSRNSPIIQNNGRDFVFKGLQVWNEHTDKVSKAHLNGDKLEDSETHNFTPHKKGVSDQTFMYKANWRKQNDKTYNKYESLMSEGLDYAFKQNPNHKFIRKLYMSAGTDAHGDFNYTLGGENTAIAELSEFVLADADHIGASTNAFGRFRTYALTSERFITPSEQRSGPCRKAFPFCNGIPAPGDHSVKAYEEGNTVVTDGPVATMFGDANCRFNSATLIYHDKECIWENYDGLVGGRGKFDGGNTMLAPQDNENVQIKYYWEGGNDYLADDNRSNDLELNLAQIYPSGRSPHVNFKAKGRYFEHTEALAPLLSLHGARTPENFSSKYFLNSALILSGKLKKGGAQNKEEFETQFKTNPIWSSPYAIDVTVPKTCPFKPGTIKVAVKFALSMDPARPGAQSNGQVISDGNSAYQGIRVHIKPLDGKGKTGDTEFLISDSSSTWEIHKVVEIDPDNDVGGREKNIDNGKFTAINKMEIPCFGNFSRDQWDADKHQPGKDRTSYAVIVSHIVDMNRNPLNPIARTFTINKKGATHPLDRFDRGPAPTDNSTGTVGGTSSGGAPSGSQGEFSGGAGTPEPGLKRCANRSSIICKRNGATCEVLVANNGAKKDVCRWRSSRNITQCKLTPGIWTTPNSRYAQNHLQAVLGGAKGACITEVKNIE